MTLKSKVKVTGALSTKTACNSAMLMVRTLKLSGDVCPQQQMILRTDVTRTFSTKMHDNLAMLGTRTFKLRRMVGPHQKMTLKAKVMVKVTMTFSTKKLIMQQCLRLRALNLDGVLVLTSR